MPAEQVNHLFSQNANLQKFQVHAAVVTNRFVPIYGLNEVFIKQKDNSPSSVSGRRPTQRLFLRNNALIRHRALLGSAGSLTLLPPHFLDRLGLRGSLPISDHFKLLTQLTAGEEAIHLPRAIHLALDADTRGQVFEKNTIGSLIDFLSASARASDEFL